MKRWKSLTAALCAAVLLCGFTAVPAYAYADGGAGSNHGDPTMETPAPEPTIEPGQGFSEEGGFVTRDLLYDENTNKQFITVQTSGGATFYLVIDYDKPVDEEGEQLVSLIAHLGYCIRCWTQRRRALSMTCAASGLFPSKLSTPP